MRLFLLLIIILTSGKHVFSQEDLPKGSHPPALEFPHFPDKVHAVIWRNWNIVPLDRLAKTLECSPSQVEQTGLSMGLPPFQTVPETFDEQMYITVIRRNWHLLPYEQLLILLNKTSGELATALKEDDFLYIKLGNLKPECSPVLYSPPTPEKIDKAGEIQQLVNTYFPEGNENGVPRLSFIDSLRGGRADVSSPAREEKGLRFIYSYFGVFGDPLINPELDPYPDGLLARLAARGVNGIWLHVVLNQLVEENGMFPEFGEGSTYRLKNLQKLVDLAAQFGISVYLYINEPRTMPVGFFDKHPGIGGVRQGDVMTMCTSTDMVKEWLTQSMAYVFEEVPGLGGVFTITASENLTNCASHNLQDQCPRCSKRDYADIIAEVNQVIEKGVHQSSPDAKVIAWDWGWNDNGDGSEVINRLPDNVWLMSVSEWKTPFERGGVKSQVGEYSISVVGPGPRARHHWAVAQDRGLKTVAKMQLNNTWELSAVPWLPVLDLNADHLSRLSHAGLDGYMLSWSLGGYPSPNLELAQMFNLESDLTKEEALNRLAAERYGKEGQLWARQAWTTFSTAFQQFPYDISTAYKAPQQYGPSNLLFAEPTEFSASMVGFPYDDLDGWRGPYSRNVFSDQFDKLAVEWEKGLEYFHKVYTSVPKDKKQLVKADYGIAKAAGLHFRSVANQCKYIMLRDQYIDERSDHLVAELHSVLDQEIATAQKLAKLTMADSRIGFEASNQYYYVWQDLVEKVLNCVCLKTQLP